MAETFGTLRAISARDIRAIALLRRVPLFADLDGDALLPLAEVAAERQLEAGDALFEQGERGDDLFVIASGQVDIVRDGQVIATLGEGDCLGEMAVIDGEARSATAVATAPTVLLGIDRDSFEGLVEIHPGLARAVIAVLVGRLRG